MCEYLSVCVCLSGATASSAGDLVHVHLHIIANCCAVCNLIFFIALRIKQKAICHSQSQSQSHLPTATVAHATHTHTYTNSGRYTRTVTL